MIKSQHKGFAFWSKNGQSRATQKKEASIFFMLEAGICIIILILLYIYI